MDGATIAALIGAARALGPWGLLALALALNVFPALMVLAFWGVVEWRRVKLSREGKEERLDREKRQARAFESYVATVQAEVRSALSRVDDVQDDHRREVARILEKHGDSLRQVTDFYHNNVELVRSFQRLSEDFHTTITLNTQVMQKVCDKIDANWFCPVLKERGGRS